MFVLDPRNFLTDPDVKTTMLDYRADLLAGDIEIRGTNKYVVASYKVGKGNCLVVKTLVPYAMERTDPGTSTEDFAFLNPDVASGHFSFEPQVNGNAPIIARSDFNAPRISTGTLLNKDRLVFNGFSNLSNRPKEDAQTAWHNPMFSFIVPSETSLDVVFTILRQGLASPMLTPYTIGVAAERRVDFAGVIIVGLEMPEQTYKRMLDATIAAK